MFNNLAQPQAPQPSHVPQPAPVDPTAGMQRDAMGSPMGMGMEDSQYDESIKQDLDHQMNNIDDEKKVLVAKALVDYPQFPQVLGAIMGQEVEDYFSEKQSELQSPSQDSVDSPQSTEATMPQPSTTQAEDTPNPKLFG